jgi:hypothetical protein
MTSQLPAATIANAGDQLMAQAPDVLGDALDVDDLQNFFPWDLHALMEIGEAMSQNGTEDGRSQSWAATY